MAGDSRQSRVTPPVAPAKCPHGRGRYKSAFGRLGLVDLSTATLRVAAGSVMRMPASAGVTFTWQPRRDLARGEP